jgi:hypothetical protein
MHLFPWMKTHVPPTAHHGILRDSGGGDGCAAADNVSMVEEFAANHDGRTVQLAFICP